MNVQDGKTELTADRIIPISCRLVDSEIHSHLHAIVSYPSCSTGVHGIVGPDRETILRLRWQPFY